jgi:hypothetical protein
MSIYNELYFVSKNKSSINRYKGMQGAIEITQKKGVAPKDHPEWCRIAAQHYQFNSSSTDTLLK